MNVAATDWHFISPEYPPQRGGVGDVARVIAQQLAAAGDEVHVWTGHDALVPAGETREGGVCIHRLVGNFSLAGLRQLRRGLDSDRPAPPRRQRLFLHWVPHGYGMRAMNVFLVLWLLARARGKRGLEIDLFVHEPSVGWSGSLMQRVVAIVHRLMLTGLLGAARRVWLSTPAWEPRVCPWLRLLGKAKTARTPVRWLPLQIDLPVIHASDSARSEFRAALCPADALLLGHFGTFGAPVTQLLTPTLDQLLTARTDFHVLLLGRGSRSYHQRLIAGNPAWAQRLHFLDDADAPQLSLALGVCDLLLQPFPDGITTRRTSALAGLAHGKPIVTNTGHLTETMLWREADAVRLIPAGADRQATAVSLCEASIALLTDPSERQRLARQGEAFYAAQFATGDYHTLLG